MNGFCGRTSFRALAIACVTAASVCGTSLAAQTADTNKPDNSAAATPEIIVTAQFRRQRLQDTPLAITAVDSALLEAKQQTNLSDVADHAPNVSLRPQAGAFGASISASIRGVGQTDFNPAYEPGVGIYIDDVYYPQLTGANLDLLDLDRVEILRGPQGTLSGRNSEGGSIKLYSKKPAGGNDGFVEGSYGSRKLISLRASADFTIAKNLYGRLSGAYLRQDGYVKQLDYGCVNPPGSPLNPLPGIQPLASKGNCQIGTMGDKNYQAIRGMMRYAAPNMDLEVLLSGDYTHEQRSNAAEVLIAAKTVDTVNVNPQPDIPFDSRFICGRFCNYATYSLPAGVGHYLLAPNVPLNAFNGKNQARYDGYNLSGNVHLGLTDALSIDNILAYGHFTSSWDDGPMSPTYLGAGHNDLRHWNWSEELRLNIKPIKNVVMVLGGYYFKQNTGYDSYQDLRYVPVYPLQFDQPDVVTANSKAAFANAAWEIVPNLNLNAGVRYTEEAKTYNYFRFNRDGTVNRFLDPVGAAYGVGYNGPDTKDSNNNGNTTEIVRALSGTPAVYSGHHTDYRASLDYRFSPELLIYASVATGFKGGGTNPRPFNAYQAFAFGPEKLTSYEVGFKSDLFDRRLRFNLTGFISDYSDIQIGVSICPLPTGAPASAATPCAARINAGDGRYKGFEGELSARPVDGLSIDGSFSYLDFHYTNILPSALYDATSNAGGVLASDPPLGSPQWKWNIGAQYEVPIGDAGTITPRVDVAYTGKIYAGPDTVSKAGSRLLSFIPSYTLVNARLTWRNVERDLDISLEARNLFKKYYYLQYFDLRSAGSGTDRALVGEPRTIALTIKKKF